MNDRIHVSREDTKYGDLIHDGAFEADDDADPETDKRPTVADHDLEVHWDDGTEVGQRYTVHIAHGHEWCPIAALCWQMNHKGSYWRRGQQTRWESLPVPVRQRVAQAVAGVEGREELDPELVDIGGEDSGE
jgi:hypothetical protein